MSIAAVHPRRLLAVALSVLVSAGAACGDDEPDIVASPPDDTPDAEDGGEAATEPSLVGLEVVTAGDVTEVLAPIAFRIGKDGISAPSAEEPFGDDDFGDLDLAREDVLVIDVTETDVGLASGVEVAGTIREFDLPAAERVFDVDLDDQDFGRYRDVLAIVADRVTPRVSASPSTTTTAVDIDDGALRPAASIVGLEVTANGNVSDVVSPLAFELDKDGVGNASTPVPDDEAFDEVELSQRPALVLDTTSVDDLGVGSAVHVSGTIREFAVDDAERLFGLDLDDRIFDPFDDAFVIVATKVTRVPAAAEGPSTTAA